MVNNRGWIRTLEAVIAILIILGFILYISPRTGSSSEKTPLVIESSQQYILKEILENPNYRNCVLEAGEGSCPSALNCAYKNEILQLIEGNIPAGHGYACEICPKPLSCIGNIPEIAEKSVYTDTVMVSSRTTSKVIRLYFWEI